MAPPAAGTSWKRGAAVVRRQRLHALPVVVVELGQREGAVGVGAEEADLADARLARLAPLGAEARAIPRARARAPTSCPERRLGGRGRSSTTRAGRRRRGRRRRGAPLRAPPGRRVGARRARERLRRRALAPGTAARTCHTPSDSHQPKTPPPRHHHAHRRSLRGVEETRVPRAPLQTRLEGDERALGVHSLARERRKVRRLGHVLHLRDVALAPRGPRRRAMRRKRPGEMPRWLVHASRAPRGRRWPARRRRGPRSRCRRRSGPACVLE